MFGLRHSRTANEQRGLDWHGEPEPTNLVCLWVVRAGACTFGAPSGLGRFRHKIRYGAIRFLFARDGVEALAALEANHAIVRSSSREILKRVFVESSG
jgi:hypothetical protein